jgi:hypothetical protein
LELFPAFRTRYFVDFGGGKNRRRNPQNELRQLLQSRLGICDCYKPNLQGFKNLEGLNPNICHPDKT